MSSTAARNSFGSIKRNLWKQQLSARFNYANVAFWGVLGGGALLAYLKFDNDNHKKSNWKPLMAATGIVNVAEIPKGKGFNEYQEVYNEIAKKIHLEEDADGGVGRYGLLCRLSWHASGTYQKSDNTGGSYGGTMIHSPERLDGENKGLEVGRDFYLEIADRYPWLSRGDLWTLGGVAAVQESGGPKIPWRPGRKNLSDPKRVPDNGRLPSASEGGLYVKNLFARMGFNERETVALIGAHVLGQCHSYYSGYSGPWGPSYNMFSNDFYVRLLGDWHLKDWSGKRQYEDNETNSFMMLPTDMALKEESYFVKYVKQYAEDQDLFFNDFSKAFSTLLELGVTFPEGQKKWEFQTLDDQDIDIDDDE